MLNVKQKIKTNKKIYISIIITLVILSIILINFSRKDYKTSNIGNNKNNKTLDEVEEYILNINSYNATIEITVNSNKNTNKYILKQICNSDYEEQEIIEPNNIKGTKIIYKDNSLKIENTNLNAHKLYNKYEYMVSNSLWLNSFINDYKTTDCKEIKDQDQEFLVELKVEDNKIRYKELYLDKKTLKPTKLILKDNSKNTIIYILYNEIEINY